MITKTTKEIYTFSEFNNTAGATYTISRASTLAAFDYIATGDPFIILTSLWCFLSYDLLASVGTFVTSPGYCSLNGLNSSVKNVRRANSGAIDQFYSLVGVQMYDLRIPVGNPATFTLTGVMQPGVAAATINSCNIAWGYQVEVRYPIK